MAMTKKENGRCRVLGPRLLGILGILRLSVLFRLDTFSEVKLFSHYLKSLTSCNNKFKQWQKPLSVNSFALSFTIVGSKLSTFLYIVVCFSKGKHLQPSSPDFEMIGRKLYF